MLKLIIEGSAERKNHVEDLGWNIIIYYKSDYERSKIRFLFTIENKSGRQKLIRDKKRERIND